MDEKLIESIAIKYAVLSDRPYVGEKSILDSEDLHYQHLVTLAKCAVQEVEDYQQGRAAPQLTWHEEFLAK